MPFFMVIDLLKQIAPPSNKPTRKQVIDNMRAHNKLHGWV